MYEIYEKLLKAKGVTTADVCKATGIRQSTMSTWKKRRTTLNMTNAKLIADYFEVPVDYLLGKDSDGSFSAHQDAYYLNDETRRVAQKYFEDPNYRLLFDAAEDVDPEAIKLAAEMLNKFKGARRD